MQAIVPLRIPLIAIVEFIRSLLTQTDVQAALLQISATFGGMMSLLG